GVLLRAYRPVAHNRSHHILRANKEGRRLPCDNSGVGGEELAINGGPKVRERQYPPWPVLGDEEVTAVTEVLRSGKLTQLTGDHVAAFEPAFAGWHGVDHCAAPSSGTSAIHPVLFPLGLGPGVRVSVRWLTRFASAPPELPRRRRRVRLCDHGRRRISGADAAHPSSRGTAD